MGGRGKQLSLNIGGATVDTAQLGSISFAKGVAEIDSDVNKGADVIVKVRARVLGASVKDVYDAHGNIKQTIKSFVLRADDLLEFAVDSPDAYKAQQESEDDAVSNTRRAEAAAKKAEAENAGDEPAPAEPDDSSATDGARHLATV